MSSASSRPIRTTRRTLTLGISTTLQRAAVAGLGQDRGAVVMLDPTTGEILALASTPTYDTSAIANPATSVDAFARRPQTRPRSRS